MDDALQGISKDLKFTLYKCIAFNYSVIKREGKSDKDGGDGMMEFVEGSHTI